MKYEYCIFLNEIKVSKIFQTPDAATIQLGILMAAYKEIDPNRWHIACREVSDWRFKEESEYNDNVERVKEASKYNDIDK